MPILDDIMDHDVIGPAIRQGLEQGRREGKQEGKQEGRREEAITMLRRLIAARFGPLSASTEDSLGKLSLSELEDLGVRLLSASNLADLFNSAAS